MYDRVSVGMKSQCSVPMAPDIGDWSRTLQAKGPFTYYVITREEGGGSEMLMFDYGGGGRGYFVPTSCLTMVIKLKSNYPNFPPAAQYFIQIIKHL